MSPVVDFTVMSFKPEASIEQLGTEAHQTWQDIVNTVSQAPGCIKQHFGRQIENSSRGVWVLLWASVDALDAFMASEGFLPWISKLRSLLQGNSLLEQVSFTPAADSSALMSLLLSPFLEVFTVYGAKDGYSVATTAFKQLVDSTPPKGYLGSAVGETLKDVDITGGGARDAPDKGPAVKLVMGWDSMDSHLEAKDHLEQAASANTTLLQSGLKTTKMYHVQLKVL